MYMYTSLSLYYIYYIYIYIHIKQNTYTGLLRYGEGAHAVRQALVYVYHGMY